VRRSKSDPLKSALGQNAKNSLSVMSSQLLYSIDRFSDGNWRSNRRSSMVAILRVSHGVALRDFRDISSICNCKENPRGRAAGNSGNLSPMLDDSESGKGRSSLLGPRHQRPCGRAAKQRDELAPLHSITSSARASSVGGTSRPRTLAVCKLMMSSNLVARRIGRSAGFSPLRTRSRAIRRILSFRTIPLSP
jgi:hypothetical protein